MEDLLLLWTYNNDESSINVYSYVVSQVNVKLRLPAVLNKFLQHISISAEEFFPQWRSLTGPPLKLQEVVCILHYVHGEVCIFAKLACSSGHAVVHLFCWFCRLEVLDHFRCSKWQTYSIVTI